MIELIISKRDNEVTRYSFDHGSINIGRSPENEVYLNSPSVSPQHAHLSISDGICSIQNTAAKGSTFINNLEIKRAQLYDKDVIRIGQYSIEISIDHEQQQNIFQETAGQTTESAPEFLDHTEQQINPAEEIETDSVVSNSGMETPLEPVDEVDREIPGDKIPPAADTYVGASHRTDTVVSDEVDEQSREEDPAPSEEGGKAAQSPAGNDVEQEPQEPITEGSLPPLHGTGIDVLSGPAEGKRVYFTRDRAVLGIKDVTAVTIKSTPDGYVAQAPNADIIVTLNGSEIAESPVSLDSGDLIAFGSLKARFFIEVPAD